jgi:predicted  nucleic acid-binding Zn-ribbon protein
MKNSLKITALVLFVAVVGFSSCVKTDIAPEVTALRQSQVDKLKADIAGILANNSYKQSQTRQLKMQITFDSLNNALSLSQSQAQYTVTLENIKNQIEIEKRFLAQNQLATAQAIAAYNKFVAEGNFSTNVTLYLGNYTTATNDLNQLYVDRLNKVKTIATAQLLLNAGTGPLTWDAQKAILQTQLTDKNAELTAAKAALTSLQGVYDNPATLDATKTALSIQIKDLADQNAQLDIDVQKATNTLSDATTALNNANTVITNMTTIDASITTKNGEIVTATAAVTTATNAIGPLTTTLALANSTLASATSSLATAQSAYDAKLAAYNTANTAWNTANDDVIAKTTARDVALNNWNADLTNTALQTIYNNAVAALATANTTLTTATTAKNNAQTALTAANGTLGTATTTFNTAKTNATNAQTALTTGQTNLTTAQTTLATKNTDLAILVANKANIQTAYDSAVANLATLRIAVNTATNAKAKVVADEAANTALQASLNLVLTTLSTQLTNILTVINGQKATITTLESDVALLNKQISQNGIDKIAAQDQITVYQAELAVIDVKITEKIAAIATWKKLLDDALAGKI